ncbi:MAG TPA: UDP-N-acetylmuramoyl-tripeptide--D-alanyl-D-alanine ligase [Actinomycetes bacterium]|nr:UDP-N-acetylmuramoyl-tripeptide--D-alanyl-D-alanine ligase [Actinomycetes bacterium]
MIPTTLGEIAATVSGRLADGAEPDRLVTGPVEVDSRLPMPGGLFVAVPGERVDGHDFAAEAIGAGAVAVLATRPVGVPAIVVGDSVAALGRLAAGVLARLPAAIVVGVTGSSGKTSTKDLLAAVLPELGPTIAPPGSHNTEIGLPLTVLRADRQTRYLALEMGARGAGHIAYLCEIAPPKVGVVLNVGLAHAESFGSREGIAKAKSELVQALPADGVAVLNADDDRVLAMRELTGARVISYGTSRSAEVRAAAVELDQHGRARFVLRTPAGSAPVALRLVGAHQVSNALATAAAAGVLGLAADRIAAALSAAEPTSRWRMEVAAGPDGITVINDAYNANPDSMRAALQALVAIGRGRRTWAVLGEMRELGAAAADEHEAIGRLVARLNISGLVTVGEGARPIQVGAGREPSGPTESVYVADAQAALALVRARSLSGDVVLVKASRAIGLEQVAAGLLESAAEAGADRTDRQDAGAADRTDRPDATGTGKAEDR